MKLILSNSTKGAYEGVLKKLTALIKNDEKCVVITTDRMTATVERAILSSLENEGDLKAMFNVTVSSFTRIASKMLGGKIGKCLTPEGSVMLLADVIERHKSELHFYQNVPVDGLSSELYAAITALRNSGVSPENLIESIDRLPYKMRDKVNDIALVYQNYLAMLGENRTDSSTRLEALRAQIADGGKIDEHYFIVDFTDFNAPQFGVIEELEKKTQSLTIGVVDGIDSKNGGLENGRIYPIHTIEKLKKLSDGPAKIEYYFENYSDEVRPQIGRYLFSYEKPKKTVENKGKIILNKARTRRDEVLAVAVDIVKKIRADENCRFKDFEVLATDLQDYAPIFKSTFARYDIPFFIDAKEMLFEQTKVRYVLSALKTVAGNFRREDVLEFVKNPLFVNLLEGENVLVKNDKIFLFENYLLEFSIEYGIDLTDFKYGDFAVAKEVQQTLVNTLRGLNFRFNEISFYVVGCRKLLADCEEGWRQHIAEISKMSAYYTKCAEQVDDKINSVLDEMDSVLKGEYTIGAFCDVFRSMLKTLKIALVPTFLDCVFIGDLSSKFTGGKDVYIVGANTGLFPTESAGGASITPKDEEIFNGVGIQLYPDERQKARNELFSVTELFKKPVGQIVVSYSETSKSGQMHPSTVIAQLQSMLTENGNPIEVKEVVVNDFYKLDEIDKHELAKSIFSTKRACCYEVVGVGDMTSASAKREDKDVYDAASSALNYAALNGDGNDKDYVQKIKMAGKTALPERLDQRIEINHTSVSRLEKFYNCPYSYFITYTLGLNRREEGDVQTNESGTIVHDVLENFFKGVKNHEVTKENAREYADKKFEEAIKNIPKWDRLRHRHDVERLIDRLKTECIDTCYYLYENNCHSKYQPFELEMEFKRNGEEHLFVEVDGKQVEIIGKIDRVDNFGDEFIIIDYKTYKSADVCDEDLYTGNKLQLFVYAATISENKGWKLNGVFYQPLFSAYESSDSVRYRFAGQLTNCIETLKELDERVEETAPNMSCLPLKYKNGLLNVDALESEEKFVAKEKYALAMVKEGVRQIKNGYIKPTVKKTKKDSACSYCDFKDYCKHKDEYVRAEKKLGAFDFDLDKANEDFIGHVQGEYDNIPDEE